MHESVTIALTSGGPHRVPRAAVFQPLSRSAWNGGTSPRLHSKHGLTKSSPPSSRLHPRPPHRRGSCDPVGLSPTLACSRRAPFDAAPSAPHPTESNGADARTRTVLASEQGSARRYGAQAGACVDAANRGLLACAPIHLGERSSPRLPGFNTRPHLDGGDARPSFAHPGAWSARTPREASTHARPRTPAPETHPARAVTHHRADACTALPRPLTLIEHHAVPIRVLEGHPIHVPIGIV